MSAFNVSAINPPIFSHEIKDEVSRWPICVIFPYLILVGGLIFVVYFVQGLKGETSGSAKAFNSVTYPRGTKINCLLQGPVIN